MWNKICRVDNEVCGNDVRTFGDCLCRNILRCLGCDSWACKIKVSMGEVGFEKMKSCNFKGNGLSLLMGLVDGHDKNCTETSEQKCHGKFMNLLVTWCWIVVSPSYELKVFLWVIIKMFTLRWWGNLSWVPCLNISHAYPHWVFWLMRCSTFGKWEIVGPLPFS